MRTPVWLHPGVCGLQHRSCAANPEISFRYLRVRLGSAAAPCVESALAAPVQAVLGPRARPRRSARAAIDPGAGANDHGCRGRTTHTVCRRALTAFMFADTATADVHAALQPPTARRLHRVHRHDHGRCVLRGGLGHNARRYTSAWRRHTTGIPTWLKMADLNSERPTLSCATAAALALSFLPAATALTGSNNATRRSSRHRP